MPESDKPDDAAERLVQFESSIAHLQHDFDQINEVVLRQQRELDDLKQLLEKLLARMDKADAEPEVRDIEAERPPHY